ncbi:MAG TPA: outer membrane beta-barrel protein, partial [Chryseosolibacter sp.]
IVASGRVFGSYDFGKGWGAQFFSFYRGRQVQLQGTQGGFYMYSLGFRKEFNEKRGSIGLAAENFLQTSMKIRTELESPLLKQTRLNTRNNLGFRVTFSYRIGKMSMDQQRPRRKRSINNDDLKDDGGGDGGMQGGAEGFTPQGTSSQRPTVAPAQNNRPAVQILSKSDDKTIYGAAGTWTYTIDSPRQDTGTIILVKNGDQYSGIIRRNGAQQEEVVLNDVKVEKNEVTFSYDATFAGNTTTVKVETVIASDQMSGTMSMGEARTFNLSAKRTE